MEALGNCPVCPHPHQEKKLGWLGSQVVSVLDSGAEGPGSNRSRDAVLGKLLTPIVPLFTKQQNWQQPS